MNEESFFSKNQRIKRDC